MAAKLHLFNPDNDLALAANVDHYTAPRAAADLRRSGALLPMWYADGGDRVLCHGINARWFDKMRTDFDIDVDVFDHMPSPRYELRPWGWSRAARTDFANEGFPPEMLPTDAALDAMRMLSHRRTAALVAAEVAAEMRSDKIVASARETSDIAQVEAALARGPIYIKAPWSSSGRGVLSSAAAGREHTLRQAADAIAHQGSVMIEDAFDKALDFACIYECCEGRCNFLSTSVFVTDTRGGYVGNLLADESVRRSEVERQVGAGLFAEASEAVRCGLEKHVAPHYTGIVGVDMMASASGILVPVVEINLRATMGYAANRFADRYLAPGKRGVFTVAPRRAPEENNAYTIESHRLATGRLPLVPSGTPFRLEASIAAE